MTKIETFIDLSNTVKIFVDGHPILSTKKTDVSTIIFDVKHKQGFSSGEKYEFCLLKEGVNKKTIPYFFSAEEISMLDASVILYELIKVFAPFALIMDTSGVNIVAYDYLLEELIKNDIYHSLNGFLIYETSDKKVRELCQQEGNKLYQRGLSSEIIPSVDHQSNIETMLNNCLENIKNISPLDALENYIAATTYHNMFIGNKPFEGKLRSLLVGLHEELRNAVFYCSTQYHIESLLVFSKLKDKLQSDFGM